MITDLRHRKGGAACGLRQTAEGMHACILQTQGKHSRAQFRSSVANRSAIRLVTTHVFALLQPLTEAISPRQNEAEGHDQSSFLYISSMVLLGPFSGDASGLGTKSMYDVGALSTSA